jgi:hypothetical protein
MVGRKWGGGNHVHEWCALVTRVYMVSGVKCGGGTYAGWCTCQAIVKSGMGVRV